MNQTDFAALVGASKHAQINWEKCAAAPNATALATWAAHGLDVLYVVTGQRTSGMPLLGDAVREMSLPGQALRETGVAIGQAVSELKAAVAMPEQAPNSATNQSNEPALAHLTPAPPAPIDPERLSRIVEMLETTARLAGRKWQFMKLVAVAAEVYNVLADEPALDEPKVERILKLVVNR